MWQGSRLLPGGDWALLGTTMWPGYTPECYEHGDADALTAQYPQAAEAIARLTARPNLNEGEILMYYDLSVGGLTRHLPIMPVSDKLAIASFVILGDCELVTAVAPLLAEKLPEVDYLVTAEAKGIPLVQEMCRVMGMPYYVVARKSVKPYMKDPLSSTVVSITTPEAPDLVP